MELPLQKHLPFRFAEYLSDEQFEDLCRDLWGTIDGIRGTEKHARKGQKQYGVDIIGRKIEGKITLGSCKNYKKFRKPNLEKAIAEFWEHRAYWRDLNAEGLLIFIGSPKEDRELQEAILRNIVTFAAEQFDFDVWDNRDLTDQLRKCPEVGKKHFDPEILARLYGSSAEISVSSPSLSGSNLGVAGSLKESIVIEFTTNVEELLPNIRKKARKGHWEAALKEIEELIASPRWQMLDSVLRSRVLVLSASLHLDARNDVIGARTRIQLAKELDSSGRFQVVESVIALRTQGSGEALQRLDVPESTDAWNIKLSLLINLGRSDEVLATVESPTFEPNSGTYRVASLAAVVIGDFEKARSFSGLAFSGAPEEYHVRLQAACLRYLEAILPTFKDGRFLEWPIPPDWEFVLSTESAIQALEGAVGTFSQLLEIEDLDAEARVSLEGWKLGCLANHPERQNDAAAFAKELLTRAPAHIPALVWSLERGFDFDRNASKEALQLAVSRDSSRENIHALCHILIKSGSSQEAAELLDRYRDVYAGADGQHTWRHLRIQLAVGLEDTTLSDALVQEELDVCLRAELLYVTARINASKVREPKVLVAAALEAYDATKDPHYLFEACETALMSGDPEPAANHANELIAQLPSHSTLFVAAQGALEAGHYSQTQKLLDTNSHLVPAGESGNRLRRLKVACLTRQGDLSEAIKLAEDLVGHDPNLSSLIALFQTQVTGADFYGGVKTARKLIYHPDISGVHLIQIAKAIHLSDRDLAAAALQKALDKGLPEEALGEAISIGFRLQKDDFVGPILENLAKGVPNEGSSIRMLSIDEIRAFQRARFQQADQFFNAYRNGDAPIHFGESTVGPGVFHLFLRDDADAVILDSLPTLVRSGSQKVRKLEIGKGELFMDFTALLLAQEAGVLTAVEQEFGPIWISPHSITVFRSTAEFVSPAQPKALEALRKILIMIEEGKIALQVEQNSICGVSSAASPEKHLQESETHSTTWICSLNPSEGLSASKQNFSRQITPDNLIAAVERLSATEYDLPVENPSESEEPLCGASVRLGTGVAAKLAMSNILVDAARLFSLSIATEEKKAMENQVSNAVRMASHAERLLKLAGETASKVASEKYRYVIREEELQMPNGEIPSSAESALYDLEQASKQGAKFVWCDDRFVNSFEHFETAQILGVSEVLRILRQRGQLSRGRCFQIIGDLRAKNFRYLPVTRGEILWCIRASIGEDGKLAENQSLAVLRQYTALCILDAPLLKAPISGPDGGNAKEYRWAFDSFQAVAGAIGALWADDSIAHKARLRACDYLLSDFFWPMLSIIEIAEKPHAEMDKIHGQAAAIAVLMTTGITLDWVAETAPQQRKHRRAQFNDWLERRLLKPMVDVSPSVIKELAKIEADSLSKLRGGENYEQKALRVFLARAIFDLPEIIKSEIEFDRDFQNWVGLKKGKFQVSFGSVIVDARPLWNAVSKATSRMGGRVKHVNGNGEIRFTKHEKWSPCRRLRLSGDGMPTNGRFSHDALPIIFGKHPRLQKALFRRIDWFDMGTKERADMARNISVERNPAKRVESFLDCRSHSLEWLYCQTASRLRSHAEVDVMELVPASLQSFATHLRLSVEELESGVFELDDCAIRLIADIGLARTAERFVHLPIPLPTGLVAEFEAADEKLRSHVLSRLARTVRHPLGMIQSARLFAVAGIEETVWSKRAQDLVYQAIEIEESLDGWLFFEKILRWVYSALGAVERFRNAAPRSRLLLSWLHAGRLSDVFIRGNAILKDGGEIFARQAQSFGIDLGGWQAEQWHDCMHPRFAQRCPVLLTALASVIERLPPEVGAELQCGAVFGLDEASASDASLALLLRDNSLMKNQWNSFLGGEVRSDARGALKREFCERIQVQNPNELWPVILAGLEENPEDLGNCSILVLVLGDLPITSEFEERLRKVLCAIPVLIDPEFSSAGAANWLRFAASRLRFDSNNVLRPIVEKELEKQLERASRSNNRETLSFEVECIASCFIEMSISAGDEAQTYRQFFGRLAGLLRAWPACNDVLGPPIWSWPNRWPIDRQSGFWHFEMSRRASRLPRVFPPNRS